MSQCDARGGVGPSACCVRSPVGKSGSHAPREFEQVAVGIRSELEGSLYSKEFRTKVEALVKEFRAGKK